MNVWLFSALFEGHALRSVCMECVLSRSETALPQTTLPLSFWHFSTGLESLHWLYWPLDQILVWSEALGGGAYKIHSCPSKAKLSVSKASIARGEMLIIAISLPSVGKEAVFIAHWVHFWGGKKEGSVVFMTDSVNTGHGTKKGVLKSSLLFREIPVWRVIQRKTWRVLHSEFCPLWTSIVFPPTLFSLKLIFGSLSGPSCVGRVTKGMYIFFHCCRKLLLCSSAFNSFLQPQKCCAKRAKGGCALALPAMRQLILTSTWIEMSGYCQFSNRINCCG